MTKNQTTNDQIKEYILQTVRKRKPQTAKELVTLIQQTQNLPEKQITDLLTQLENEDKLRFTKQEPPTPASARAYIFSQKAAWYWTTITLAIATTITVFTIPENAYPIVYVRSILGIVFVLYLPGYTFIKALFPSKVPTKISSENLDTIERIALSLGMSLALTPIVGLILNYTPWGITLTPITLSLLALTVILATAAILREHQTSATQSTQKT